jgi:hypothetical protein
MKINGLPQPLAGNETIKIQQVVNGQMSDITMPLSDLLVFINTAAPTWWVASLPTTLPPKAGVLWNNTGMLAVS